MWETGRQISHLQAKHTTLYSNLFQVFKRESDNAALTSMSTESQSVTYRERLETGREEGREREEGGWGGGKREREGEREGERMNKQIFY